MLVRALWFLPPPARATVASGMYDLGVRIHPELAIKQLEPQGAAGMGQHRAHRLVNASADQGRALMRQFAPHLADKMDASEEEKQQVLAELRAKHGSKIAEIQSRLAATKPEDFGP